ncbi:hypothetical protein K2V56_01625 [Staphylococcus chromogenes]|uniref:hypothetical protein n=1 Tax=Staphylococcus chromogenes TaxID=46126 RepID=UPI001E2AD817|nr:hypothetical protein [Staphylococcus chromogenes]MCD8904163.1 hypothetical protein [Staphylococcus chromogenes]
MKSDVVIEGEHATIINKLIDYKYYNSKTDVFFDGLLVGILNGRRSSVKVGNDRVEITRTWLNKSQRSNFKTLISAFINLEQHHQGEAMNIQEILNDKEGTDSSSTLKLMKEYALYGIEKINEIYFLNNELADDMDYFNFIETSLDEYKDMITFTEENEDPLDREVKEILNEMS